MTSFAHKKIVGRIAKIDNIPSHSAELREWVGADQHLRLLQENAHSDEVIVYASGPYTFIHSIVVPNEVLADASKKDLLKWSCNPYTSCAGYVSSSEGMWIERGTGRRGCEALDQGWDLIFGRTFEGWSGDGRDYFEASQEYTHLTGIHWRQEHSAYCKFDENGDLRPVISVTTGGDPKVLLASFTSPELREYLAIADASLVRMFDFTLLDHKAFTDWPDVDEQLIERSDAFYFRQRRGDLLSYTRGIQILRPDVDPGEIEDNHRKSWRGDEGREHAEFIAHDWRNRCVRKISTAPAATANYFNAEGNDLPFELSPAFFRPEVLSKYKTDREKYTVAERSVSCRTAWHLKGYDVNEAGQIHVYICDLRMLPYSEQLHWLAFNEEPKAGISDRAVTNDFEGEFVTYQHPREAIVSMLRRWAERPIAWWGMQDEALFDRGNIPISSSTDEWANAFLDLSKLIVEGFRVKQIRKRLDSVSVSYDEKEQSILLLERLLSGVSHPASPPRLEGLRTIQLIRSKVAGHTAGSEAKQIASDAIATHGSYRDHFAHVCGQVVQELETIASAFEAA